MSTSLTYFYLFLAFMGTILFVFDPSAKFQKMMANKTSEEVNDSVKSWINNNDETEVGAKGCGVIFFIVISLLYAFVIDPIAAISAISNHRGNVYIAIAMLVILVVQWLRLIFAIKNRKNPKTKKVNRIVDKVDGDSSIKMVEEVEVIKTTNPIILFVRRVFYSLPEFYLWYLFLVGIGVFAQG